MVAELRKIGDKLALYTNDNRVYRSFAKGVYPLCKIPYTQDGRLVGVDLYFDKKVKNTIIQLTKLLICKSYHERKRVTRFAAARKTCGIYSGSAGSV